MTFKVYGPLSHRVKKCSSQPQCYSAVSVGPRRAPDQRQVPSGEAVITSMREEPRVAPSALRQNLDVGGSNTDSFERHPHCGAQVEVNLLFPRLGAHDVGAELGREAVGEISIDLEAAGLDRWPDRDSKIVEPRAERQHPSDGLRGDGADHPAPACVHGGDRVGPPVFDQDGQTVGGLHAHREAGRGSEEGVGLTHSALPRRPVHLQHGGAVDLMNGRDPIGGGADGSRQPLQVLFDAALVVAHREGEIQGGEGAFRDASRASRKTMWGLDQRGAKQLDHPSQHPTTGGASHLDASGRTREHQPVGCE